MTQSGPPAIGEHHETVETRTARQLFVVLAVVFLLWLAVQLKVIIVDVIIAITLASAISPIARKFEAKRVPRAVTVLLTYVLVASFYCTIGYLLWKPISTEAMGLYNNWDSIKQTSITRYNSTMQSFGIHAPAEMSDQDIKNVGNIILHKTLDVTTGAAGVAVNVLLVLFLCSYFVINSHRIVPALLAWVPLKFRARADSLVVPVANRMGGYVRGQLLVSTAVAIFFAIGFSLIKLEYGLVLGLVAGVLNLIPFVGSMSATVLAVLVAASDATDPLLKIVLTLVVFGVEQAVESNFITPYLLGSQVELDPLIVLIAILIGATLGGAVGALIAVPIASALLLIGQELYLKPMQEQESIITPAS